MISSSVDESRKIHDEISRLGIAGREGDLWGWIGVEKEKHREKEEIE